MLIFTPGISSKTALPHASIVAPVVITSSTSNTCLCLMVLFADVIKNTFYILPAFHSRFVCLEWMYNERGGQHRI